MKINSKHPHGFLLLQGIGVLLFGILGLRVTGSILLSVRFVSCIQRAWTGKALKHCPNDTGGKKY